MFLFLESFRLSLMKPTVKSTKQFSQKCRVHCLKRRTFRSLSSLPGLSLYWNNTFVQTSNDCFSFTRCAIKASACKDYSDKKTKDGPGGTFLACSAGVILELGTLDNKSGFRCRHLGCLTGRGLVQRRGCLFFFNLTPTPSGNISLPQSSTVTKSKVAA